MPMTARFGIGLVLAALIAAAARRTRSLSASGAIAATVVGASAVAAGWSWGALLIIYFASSTFLSHLGRAVKERRTVSMVAKGGERDAVQVLANGGMFAAAALIMLLRPDVRWIVLGAGSLAASAADTWATEIGTLYGREPRLILPPWRAVAAGTSGGLSLIGTIGGIGGALLVALAAVALGWTTAVGGLVVVGGVAGTLIDSLLGATLQSRRWCDTCERRTERIVHDCGADTRRAGGLSWLDNDMVNFLSNATGGLLAALLA
jgi:uncharacterized protein (TIGR00297 family)